MSSSETPAPPFLFVCKGNICRSPFAEKLLVQTTSSSRLSPSNIRSTGHYPIPGRTSPPEAIKAARSYSIDLQPHRSRVITREDLEQASTVIVMDSENETECLARGAREEDILYLSSFHPERGDREMIRDPFGGPPEAFERCYETISIAIQNLAQRFAS